MPRPNDPLVTEDLPPLDVEDDTDELDDRELGTLLGDLPELIAIEEGENDLDIGLETEALSELAEDDGGTTDVGGDADELSLPADDEGGDAEGAAFEADLFADLDPPRELASAEDEEGSSEDFVELDPAALLGLDTDDTEGVSEPDDLPLAWTVGDEPRPALAERGWTEAGPNVTLEPCLALATVEGTVVAASSDLLWFAPGALSPLRLEAGSSRIHSVALAGSGWEYAVCSTTSGRLLRRGRLASASEELRRVREAAELAPSVRELFDLCQPGPAFPHALVLRTAGGVLLRSDDDGATFRRVTERRIVALAARGAPALALTEERSLLASDDGGGTFAERALPEAARSVATGRSPLLAAFGSTVAIGDAELGVALSNDAAASFQHVGGTRGVTALSAGDWHGAGHAFAALYDEADDRSWLVRIDAQSGRAETVALIEIDASDDEEIVERSRVVRLEWEAAQGRLWAVGTFGVKVFAPPSDA